MAGEGSKPTPSGAEGIFTAALALPPAGRSGYLTGACGEDLKLRQRVEALLRAHEAPEGFLPETPGAPSAALEFRESPLATCPSEQPGDRIGRYKLRQKIGEGGCGVVYMAEQEEPVRRKVALKIIKLGMDTKQVVARFEAERQALALMDHPNIAKVLDAGATETGRPYFVMELVGGVRITDYCDQNQLTTRQRLELFIQVCRAIQHAHQKGIIHRDIKPSNVLVAIQDGAPVPKVIDFGIAKATQGRLTDQTVFTAFEQFIGTPAYMSPEQAQLGGLDVDTRSDIYSLGVLLYELLTGKTPFDTQAMLSGGLDQIRRTIQEKEPSRPSTRLSTMEAGELKTAAERRTSDAARLIHVVRGDLDWIVMKCLEKERARRYETANGLAMDIERHLKQEPVVARPPSAAYKFHKFIRRNRLVTLMATAVVVGFVASTWEAVRAWRAEREQGRLRQQAIVARQDATEKLWASGLSEARALRMSGQAGRRFNALLALKQAAQIRPSLALRNEAVACVANPDMRRLVRKDFAQTHQSASIDPALQNYAVSEASGAVSMRRLKDDYELAHLPASGAAVTLMDAFSPDGRLLPVLYADGHWRIWDWGKGAAALTFEGDGISFSRDSHLISYTTGTNVIVRDISTGNSVVSSSCSSVLSPGAPGWVRFSPGQRLAVFQTKERTKVFILDPTTGEKIATLEHAAPVMSLAWHPDGHRLAVGCADQTIHIWDAVNRQKLQTWHTESSVSVCFNHRGDVLASSGWDGHTRLWNFETGTQLIAIQGGSQIFGFSPDDSKLAERFYGGEGFEFFEVALAKELQTLNETEENSRSDACQPVIDSSGRTLAIRSPGGYALWDLQGMRQTSFLPRPIESALVGFAGDKNLFFTAKEGLFRCPVTISADIKEFELAGPVLVNKECSDPVIARVGMLSGDGKICAVIMNDHCDFFRTDTFDKQSETSIQRGMRFGAINHDGSLFASGAWQLPGVSVWDTRKGKLLKDLPPEPGQSNSSSTVVFSPDGNILVTATIYDYRFWDLQSWKQVRCIPQAPENDFVPAMAFSRDGTLFAGTSGRHKIILYNGRTGQLLVELESPNDATISGIAFNPDASQLIVCDAHDGTRVWDLRRIRRQLAELGLDWEL